MGPVALSDSSASVLFQAPNSIGLGHINRLAAIALALRAEQKLTRSVFAIDGQDHGLLQALELPSLPLPSASLSDPTWSSWAPKSRALLIHHMCESLLAGIKPSIVVFDCIPYQHLATLCQQRNIPICLVARKTKSIERYTVELRPLLDAAAGIIVPHAQEEFALPRQWESKTHYVGDIVRPRHVAADTAEMIAGPGPKVVITGGGGGYPGVVNFYNLALAACANCRKTNPDLSTILVAGPLFKDWSKLRLEGATLFPSHLDMPGLYERAALVICQAGYNTVAEVLRSSKPAICVPAKRAFDDQSERAHLAASRQRAFIVVEKPTVANLSASIVSCLR